MKRFAAGVVLAALLALFVARITSTPEAARDRGTRTVLMVAVECPCSGVCEVHAQTACDYAAHAAEAEVRAVLKLPSRHAVSQRSDTHWNSLTVINSGLRTGHVINTELRAGRVLKLPYYEGAEGTKATIHDASEAASMKGHFSVGVM